MYTHFPRGPFTSPDSQWIGFTDAGQLKKVSVGGGPVVPIATLDAPTGRGATWGLDDTIIYATTNGATGLLRVSASGGPITAVTNPDRELGEVDHIWPEWLPSGNYTSPGNPGRTYDVSADGTRMLMIKDDQRDAPHRLVVVQHWLDELRRAVPAQ